MRQLVPSSAKALSEAYPGQPVEVTGWKDLPSAGDEVLEASSEEEAKKAVENRKRRLEKLKMLEDVEAINEKRRLEAMAEEEGSVKDGPPGAAVKVGKEAAEDLAVEGEGAKKVKELRLVIKGDFTGTVEAVVGAVQGIGNSEAQIKVVSQGVGDVTEGDVNMAATAQGKLFKPFWKRRGTDVKS